MEVKRKTFKAAVIVMLVGSVSVLHYGAIHGHLGLHTLQRELYFVPILLASFWFGLKKGVITAIVVSLVYAPYVVVFQSAHNSPLTVGIQVLVFNLVAALLGWLVDRQRREHAKAISNENLIVLGRASALIGHEMEDLLNAMKSLYSQYKGLKPNVEKDFELEMARLAAMVEVLSSFAPSDSVDMISRDLNKIIDEQVGIYQDLAKREGVALSVHLDKNGCPSRVDTDKLGWVVGHFIQNAIEFSNQGQTIHIRSQRHGNTCKIEIQDQGTGIKQEHLPKIFTPFFTTKEDGYGLTLAASKKIMKEMGSDIRVFSKWGEGATFTITVPREDEDRPISKAALSAASRTL
jgi:signal transduction histidine kinase